MPFGGKHQQTPIQAMVHKVSLEQGHTDTCSLMSWGYNPFITERSPYHGAYLAVVESAAKLVATGAAYEDVYLTFQEYFKRLGMDPERWGSPLAALLGALKPFLRQERREKMEKAEKIARLSRVVRVALQLLKEEGDGHV